MPIEFLQLEDVLYIHQDQIERYGGDYGVRDVSLLESAMAQPKATFGGEQLHKDLFEMAAAYLFHVVQNHPFVDGNKRAGAVAALVFLEWNRIEVCAEQDALVDITIRVASGRAGKGEVAAFFRTLAK